MAFEILVTKEFCRPIANSNEQMIMLGYLISMKLLKRPIDMRMIHSIIVGKKNTLSFLFSLNTSIRKLDVNDPVRKDSIYRK